MKKQPPQINIYQDKFSTISKDDKIILELPLDKEVRNTINGDSLENITLFKFQANIIKKKIEQYNIPISEIANIKNGADFKRKEGKIIKNKELTTIAKSPYSYAFCSDTTLVEENIATIKGVTLLYHEATFMKDLVEKARQTGHSTTIDAATMAKKATVKKLVIGHFSTRYKNLDDLLSEAKSVFKNTELATDGSTFNFDTY